MALPLTELYTIEDIYDLPDGERAELIDGEIYYWLRPAGHTRKFPAVYSPRSIITSKEKKASVKCLPPLLPYF